jgi:acylglycerol lipase
MEEKVLIAKYSIYIPGISILFPIENWFQFVTRDGLALHTYKYPASSLKCVLITLHGINSYSQPTGVIAKALAEAGCEVVAFDFRGHGKSQGIKGYLRDFELLITDTLDFVNEISKLYNNIPLFIMGGSLGGTVAINISLKVPQKISGLILINPALGINSSFEGCIRVFSTCLASCCPTLPIYKSDGSLTTKNENLRKYMRENPYYYNGKVRIGTSAAVLNALNDTRKRYNMIKSNLLVIQGRDDNVVSLEKVQDFMKIINVDDKRLLMYPGLPHSIVFEEAIFDIAEQIKNWVIQRI